MTQEELDQNLFQACLIGNIHKMNKCIQNGANANARNHNGETPLHWAAWKGYYYASIKLINKGAEINVKDNDGKTPFDLAYENNKLRVASFLAKESQLLNLSKVIQDLKKIKTDIDQICEVA